MDLHDKICRRFILILGIVLMVFILLEKPKPTGEWDDFALVTTSIIYEHNLSISKDDLVNCKKLFPELSPYVDMYSLSGYTTKRGGEMAWYFGTYSLACVPIALLLKFLKLSPSYTFALTNLFFFMLSLWIVYRKTFLRGVQKLLLILLLGVNPIIFYLPWIGSEVFVFSFIIMTMVYWLNKEYKRAAFTISIAGTLNPVILVMGIAMIIEFMLGLLKGKKIKSLKDVCSCYIHNLRQIIMYGLIYVIALIPMFYNYYNVGHINLTASYSRFTTSTESTFGRFAAYITDLNFGLLPYFWAILIISLIMLIPAVIKRHTGYLKVIATFLALVYLYSIMAHINCGMAGIARYNAWSAPLVIFAVVYYYKELFKIRILSNLTTVLLLVNFIFLGFVIYKYGPMGAINTNYIYMTPIAKKVLNNYPSLYNPLGSTFNSRTKHADGAYIYETPLYYIGENDYVRKIRATREDREEILESLTGSIEDMKWINKQVWNLGKSESYINIPKEYKIERVEPYTLGTPILFYSPEYNANLYVQSGLSGMDETYSWTDNNVMKMKLKVVDSGKPDSLKVIVNIGDVFNKNQRVRVLCNGKKVYDGKVTKGQQFIQFNVTFDEILDLNFEFPDARVQSGNDKRKFALAIQRITINSGE